jgi:CheY-like chemotaxis protein
MLSANSSEDSSASGCRAAAMAVGPVAFFIKPFNDEQFLAAVHDALAQAGNA